MKVVKFAEGDPRLATLVEAIMDLVKKRGDGLPLPSVLGCMDLAKEFILSEALEKIRSQV